MNIYLNPLSVDDAENALTWVNDPEVTQYFANMQKKISLDEEREYILRLNHSQNDKAWSVFDKDCQLFDPGDPKSWRDEYIGQCSINQIYWPARNGRIFLAIKKEFQNQGLGKQVIQGLIEKAKELKLHKLWLIVRADNKKSQALYLKEGFDFEGVLKDEYFVNGSYFDMVRMGLLLNKG